MRIIHHIPFTQDEQEHYRRLIFSNLVEGVKLVVDYMLETGGAFEHSEHGVRINLCDTR